MGRNYHGSQIQAGRAKNHPDTIQEELEKALSTLIKTKIKTIFSGRTDAGVSALGQVVHFDTDKSIVASRFINSLNGLLPKDISVCDIKPVEACFHAQMSAKKRYYKYVFYNRTQRHAFDDGLLLVKNPINIERSQKALDCIKGEHDFTALSSQKATVLNKVCFIYNAECKKIGDTVEITIVGNRFLYNMVRIIVGTLLLIEKNDLPPEFMKELLESKDRSKAGKTVNPYGLTLMKVEY